MRHSAGASLSLVLFAGALWLLHRELSGTSFGDVSARLSSTSLGALGLALLLTAASYLALTGYDALALSYVRHPLPYRRVALTSFIASAVGHNLGVAMLSGGAVRMRMYAAAGMSATDVVVVIAMVSLTFGLGAAWVGGLVLVLDPAEASRLLHISTLVARGAGLAVLATIGLFLGVGALHRQPLHLAGWRLRIPGPAQTIRQICLAATDMACAGGALYVLLPADATPSFPLFLGVYVLAIVAGIASHVPSGIGVFETILVLGLPQLPKDALLAAVLLYRFVYYLLPLGLAALLAALHELKVYRRHLARGLAVAQDVLEEIAPQVMAVTVFVAGTVLLLSGATPGIGERISLLRHWVPLPLLELSHLAGSLVGLGLTVLAAALHRRVDVAYPLALALAIVGALASLLKGLDWEEALIAGFTALALWGARGAFYRRSSLFAHRFSPGWAVSILLVLGGSVWLGLFAYKRVSYAQDLWWQFAFDADASRFMRATLVAVTAVTALALTRLLRPTPPAPQPPGLAELQRAAALVARSPDSSAALALSGDKRILFDEGDAGLLMFQIRGRSWVVMGDPLGPPKVARDLAWRFRELCDRHGGRPVFYQVGTDYLPLYLDLGLSPLKIGEEALVDLAGFSLDGSARAGLRQARRKVARLGVELDVVEVDALDSDLMKALAEVSDSWLAVKNTREKGFSVGRFDPAFLRHFRCALVRGQGRILAFASLWEGAGKAELSVDLMRHVPDAPNGVMDYLFVELMLWGSAHGYKRFNLGMAPLAGLETGPLAPPWHRLGATLFRHAEHFYNFEGLRAYKEKFHPEWHPKYLAVPRGLALPTVILDVAALIAGGMRGIVAR